MNVAVAQDAVGVGIGVGLWIWFAVFAWMAPIIVAVAREVPNRAQIVAVNFVPVVGWFIALVWALKPKPKPGAFYPPPYRPAVHDGPGR